MKAPKYASSVTALAQAIGLSRQWTSELFRLGDHPRPTKSGHSVARWKKYITQRAEKVQNSGGEKARLELELLRKRIAKVDLEIADLSHTREQEITAMVTASCKQIINTLNAQLLAMPNQLSGIFAGLGEPMPIYQRFKAELNQRFKTAYDALHKIEKKSQRKTNFVPFNRSKGNGAIVLDGPGRAQ